MWDRHTWERIEGSGGNRRLKDYVREKLGSKRPLACVEDEEKTLDD